MGKLKALPPALPVLPPILSAPPKTADDIYRSARWRILVAEIKRARGPACCKCGSEHRVAGDHIVELKDGGAAYDRSNIQLLCQACHNQKTSGAARDRAERPLSGGGLAHPSWFRPVVVPLAIVCGAPGSGKSTWVRQRMVPGERLICFDTIAAGMFGDGSAQRMARDLSMDEAAQVLKARNEAIADLMWAKARARWRGAWLIVSEPEARWRRWWAETVRPECVVVLRPAAEVCKARIVRDARDGDRRKDGALEAVDAWFASYSESPVDTTIEGGA